MKRIVHTLTVLCASVTMLNAQTDFAKEYAPLMEKSFAMATEVADAMPENLYLYKPEKDAKSFAQQIIHSTYVADVVVDLFVMGNSNRKFAEPDASKMSKEEVLAAIKTYSESTIANLNKLTEAQLSEAVKLFGQVDTNKKEVFYFVRDHLTNHRAKANLYVRIAGLKPPRYGYFD